MPPLYWLIAVITFIGLQRIKTKSLDATGNLGADLILSCLWPAVPVMLGFYGFKKFVLKRGSVSSNPDVAYLEVVAIMLVGCGITAWIAATAGGVALVP